MPQRPRSHVLEDESRAALRRLLPAEWLIRNETPDYGIDASIEIVTSAGQVTGKRFFVQLKATDQQDLSRALLVKLKKKNFRYLQQLDSPVLTVVYHAPTNRLYARWVHEMDVFYSAKSKEHFSFRFSTQHELDPSRAASEFEQEVDRWRWLRSPTLSFPILLKIQIEPANPSGVARSHVMERLDELSRSLGGTLEIREVPVGTIHGEIDVDSDNIHVRLYGGSGAALHRSLQEAQRRGRRSSGAKRAHKRKASLAGASTRTEVAANILVAVAMALRHAGHIDVAAQIVEVAFCDSSISRNPAASLGIIEILLAAERHEVVVREAVELIRTSYHPLAELMIRMVTMAEPPRTGRDALRAALESFLAELSHDYPKENLGSAYYNVGRYIGVPDWDTRLGIAFFVRAARLHPTYRQRGYFWEEFAALLFHVDRFAWSAGAYERAGQLGRESSVHAKQADALWRTGRFGEARKAIAKYDGTEDHWLLLRAVLPLVIEVSQTERQARRPAVAAERIAEGLECTGDEITCRSKWTDAIRADGMSADAWFNLAISYAGPENSESAALAFLVAALIRPEDADSWACAIIRCLEWAKSLGTDIEGPSGLLGHLVTAAAQRDREALFRSLVARVPDTPEGHQLWRDFIGIVAEQEMLPPVIRITVADRTIEVPLDQPEAIFELLSKAETLPDGVS